ncbi:hypothetical protein C1637_13410 [Chryseobacterium lactis]|uniref:Uncharacterized protein n=1 Tax=Chryseobacterium lactis TaxID=1241981 RepID=A0A3G6RGU8_CHRLC|nr:hypothetical protein [Chryseobacterium lactis]AZA83876.1 hypothetical protein EG342_19155 [Chryseobacterium lactis]AZB04261.1 hypothetical protein EG341_10030 [Chryseobacterium lactis]PNW12831.1 hypothetical protein C1637_13410 [Chryseobacterium lactis]
MELDFRKLYVTKLFDFSKEDEELIFEIYDHLSAIYDISVIDIENSPYDQFKSHYVDFLQEPKLCYSITNKRNTSTFYLFIVNLIGTSIRGARTTDKYDSLELWGLKETHEDYGFISINKKKLADRIAGIFSRFNINSKENRDFKDFYVLGSDPYKTMAFLTSQRKVTIKSISDEDFNLQIKNNIIGLRIPKAMRVDNALMISKFFEEI